MPMMTYVKTTLGDEFWLPLEIGLKIDHAILQGAERVRINPETEAYLKISLIGIKENRFKADPIKDTSRLITAPKVVRAGDDSPGYKKFQEMKQRLLRKKDATRNNDTRTDAEPEE